MLGYIRGGTFSVVVPSLNDLATCFVSCVVDSFLLSVCFFLRRPHVTIILAIEKVHHTYLFCFLPFGVCDLSHRACLRYDIIYTKHRARCNSQESVYGI